MGERTELGIVRAWHEALNGGDLDGLAALLADEVEFAGPRGAGYGAAMVRDWAERAGIQMTPERWFAGGDAVVVTEQARWRDAETGEWGRADRGCLGVPGPRGEGAADRALRYAG